MVKKYKARDAFNASGTTRTTTFDWVCLSTDTKPTTGVQTNELLMELDTKNKFYFDGTTWQPFGGEAE